MGERRGSNRKGGIAQRKTKKEKRVLYFFRLGKGKSESGKK